MTNMSEKTEDHMEHKPMWSMLPDDILLQVFELLSCKEIGQAGKRFLPSLLT